ncbi:hypothetical protein BT93_I0838 [Corymbia citriodora subsp. variegata]|nr:hypothetical protein BT93_I0838 [Corymbia citriodora subsp. variegata]
MVGLWGQGGIGKTTLAKALYNVVFRQFEGSSFLANVRETSKGCRGLVTLQEILLKDILLPKQRLIVSNVDRGINLIQHRLGEGMWFGNGSRIIFTTRDKHLLTCYGIDEDHVYEVKALDAGEAYELLSKHAFPTHQKLEIKTNLVDSILNHAKGLPLALEVLGSFLYGRREHVWESTVNQLSRIPNKTINDVLKVSYDGLEENEKEIFLHIACLFREWDSKYIKKVLDSCDFEATIGYEILIERSLISIESGLLQVHDLIQLMGMDIVNQECRNDPGRRSRLWLYDDILDVLSSVMGDCFVKAIVLKPPELKEICIGPNAFTKMKRLRLLILRNVHNSFQGRMCLPNELRWFEWPGCDCRILEFSSCPKKLIGLDMRESSITVVARQFKGFQNLKYINFSYCQSLARLPDFSCTPNLENLHLQFCKNLIEVHDSIAYHDKLQVLNLLGCSKLCAFPKVLKSKNLRDLVLADCTIFERFPDIPHILEGLKELSLRETAIKELPASIENLVSLESMNLGQCESLESLPSSIYKLQKIKSLALWDCTNLIEFPKYEDSANPCMETGLSNLHSLDLAGCNLSKVESLENLSCFPFLRKLYLTGNNITSLPTSINRRDHLSDLVVANCHQLQEIPELPPSLNLIWAEGCKSLKNYGDLTSVRDFVHRGLTVADISALDQVRFSLSPLVLFPL